MSLNLPCRHSPRIQGQNLLVARRRMRSILLDSLWFNRAVGEGRRGIPKGEETAGFVPLWCCLAQLFQVRGGGSLGQFDHSHDPFIQPANGMKTVPDAPKPISDTFQSDGLIA